MSQVDSAKLMTALLYSIPVLVGLTTNIVGDETVVDIYGPPGLPTEWEIRPGLFFLGTGGPGDEYLPIGTESFDFYTYGRDSAEARTVFKSLRAAFHRRKHERITIDGETHIFQFSQLVSGPQDRTEPEEGWNLVYSSFLVQFVEVTV